MKKSITFLLLSWASFFAMGQTEDAEGCKDHPLFNRLPNFAIEDCSSNFNAVDFQTASAGKIQSIEGTVTTIRYVFNSESAKMPSPLQIVKNYENAVLKNGGKKVYQGADDTEGGASAGTYTMNKEGKEYWVTVRKMYEPQTTGEIGAFSLVILEKEGMKQDITAGEMFDKIQSEGHVALYINFETGKASIKTESQKIVDQIAEMLKANPSLSISIEGHTDNTGTPSGNKTLSEQRATAVQNALVANGIDKAKVSSKGLGQDKPIADNNTEEGRAKNRRVEIVKM